MCGIVGLLVKNPALRNQLGALMVPMLVGMTERGPDSAGLAVYTTPVSDRHHKLSLYSGENAVDWPELLARIAAGLDGIDRNLDPGPAQNINLYQLSPEELAAKGIKLLPQSLHEAIDALEQDTVICNGLGADLAREFIRLKRMEWTEYSRHVSDWESRRYLEFF